MAIVAENKLQIRSKRIIAYTKFTGFHFRTESQRKSAEQLKTFSLKNNEEGKHTYSGALTPGAKKRLARSIDLLVQSTKRTWIDNPAKPGEKMPFQIAFTTLTVHSPGRMIGIKEAYKNLLSPMLQWLRRSHNVYLYIWKAELQERGQIHYHLLLGSFVHMDALRTKWNKLQMECGYLDDYFKEHGHYDAPGTEIKNALLHNDVAGYLQKEFAKTIQNTEKMCGKIWDCSINLKEMSLFETDSNKYAGAISTLVRQNKLTVAFSDRSCTVYKANDYNTTGFLDRIDTHLYNEHIEWIKTTEYSKPEPLIYDPPPKPKVNFKVQYNMFLPS